MSLGGDQKNVIEARGVTKTYRAGVGRARFREMLPWPVDRAVARVFPNWWAKDTFEALEGVTFDVEAGSSVGIVGHNGAGKTTLLRLIAGISAPSRGSVRVDGRVGALIDVLVGFHPELTGRENIYLLGAIQGFGRKEMARRVQDILEFAEIDELADTPLKRYSAGMGARLGFGTLTQLDLEVLLIDEVLAVGDAMFQRKCVDWLEGFHSQGGTLLFVSHNMGLVRSMTDRAIWLDHGSVRASGETNDVVAQYADAMGGGAVLSGGHKVARVKKMFASRGSYRWGTGVARFKEAKVSFDERAKSLSAELTISTERLDSAVLGLTLVDDSEREIATCLSPMTSLGSQQVIRCTVPDLPLRPGTFYPVVWIISGDGDVCDRWRLEQPVFVDHLDGAPVDGLGPVTLTGMWSASDLEAAG